jgi:hypothetical protein
VEAQVWKLKIAPAARYTRWARERTPRGGGTFLNEAETLIGFAF